MTDNIIDLRSRFLEKTYAVDSFAMEVFVGVFVDGKKVDEKRITLPRGFYTADLPGIIATCEQQAEQIDQQANAAP